VISEPAWTIARHLLRLWISIGVWRNRISSFERKELAYHTGPRQISINATHITAPVPYLPRNVQTDRVIIENLASIKMTAASPTHTDFLAVGKSALGLNRQGLKFSTLVEAINLVDASPPRRKRKKKNSSPQLYKVS